MLNIRNEPYHATACELRAGSGGGQRFRLYRDEVGEMRAGVERAPDADLLERWLSHPDERVPMALLERAADLSLAADERTHLLHRLTERARIDAVRRGEDWTPLLNALDLMEVPVLLREMDRLYGTSEPFQDDLETLLDRIRELGELEPGVAQALWATGHPDLREAVAGHATMFTSEMESEVLRAPRLAHAAAGNNALGDYVRVGVCGAVVEHMDAGRASFTFSRVALKKLGDAGIAMPDAARATLIRLARKGQMKGGRHPQSSVRRFARQTLVSAPGLTGRDLVDVFDVLEDDLGLLRVLFRHPGGGPELWRHVGRSGDGDQVLTLIREKEEAVRVPEVRTVLYESASALDWWDEILPVIDQVEFDRVALSVARREPELLLAFAGDELPNGLRMGPEHLRPVLGSPERDLRLRAIQALARIEGGAVSAGRERPLR